MVFLVLLRELPGVADVQRPELFLVRHLEVVEDLLVHPPLLLEGVPRGVTPLGQLKLNFLPLVVELLVQLLTYGSG